MTFLGRRKHLRYLIEAPVEGKLRVREEVAIEEWNEHGMVVLSPKPCRMDERLVVEIPDRVLSSMTARVSECRPAVTDDGEIRHRIRLSIEHQGTSVVQAGGAKR